MAQEIERKYLVKNEEFKTLAARSVRIIQGYLSSVPERTVRVRIKGDKGYLTIKGIGNESGASRYEWENEIPVSEAEELLKICEAGVIDKTRYLVDYANHIFEVDEFYQTNQGLIVAEVELTDEAQTVSKPSWLGEEVTGDARYYNSMLMKQPYTTW
ncbi:CYTH domain-containing protein [Shewanella abyssi]|uniref:CYTH domain-containing protein n=1 Tax=Shewanella abyssi TaxID=311789 RepID=UPI002010354F|nr:CYTH domain-containing protein [Shewanella abyssi]MCL1051380.1 CYTH domain-containing protein [Shewanella abyssi]